jgi:hypothetical protein
MSLLAPDINRRKASVQFEDLTPMKSRPDKLQTIPEINDHKLPSITESRN